MCAIRIYAPELCEIHEGLWQCARLQYGAIQAICRAVDEKEKYLFDEIPLMKFPQITISYRLLSALSHN